MDIRLIALDMDGTLLDSQKRILASTQAALHKALEAGVICALDTGRAISELNQYRKELADVRYWLCESGALVYDSHEDTILKRNTIAPSAVLAVLDVLDALGQDVMVQVMRNGIVEVSARQVPRMKHYFMEAYIPLFSNTATKVASIADALRRDSTNIEKINIYHTAAAAREVTKAALQDVNVEKAYSEVTSLELSAPGLSKGTALHELCRMLGIPIERTAAVGDSDNDITMLECAAMPIVMGNAQEHIKALARLVVADNDQGGCAEAIQYCIGGA